MCLTRRILANLDDEPLPIFKIRPPDVAHPVTDSLAKKPLILDKRSVIGYLRPFQFKFEGLEGISALEPYLTQYNDQKNGQKKKGKKASKPDDTEQDDTTAFTGRDKSPPSSAQAPSPTKTFSDIDWSLKAGDNFLRGLMTYPLPPAQLKIIRLFAAQTTIVLTDLLDLEQILKLIALSSQVTVPNYGHCLFPNLRNVVFTSSCRLQMMQARHADPSVFDTTTSKVHSGALPHRTSILLYWLADSYDVCIHYPSAGEKASCIKDWAARLIRDEGRGKMGAEVAAEKSWIALDTLDCMLGPDSQKGLRALSLHSVQVGATFNLAVNVNVNVKTTIRFAPRSRHHSYGIEETIESMAKLISGCVEAQTGWVTYHNIEHLIAIRPFGPATALPMKRQKDELRLRLYNILMRGQRDSNTRLRLIRKRCREGDSLKMSKECKICGQWCEEYDCTEKSKLDRKTGAHTFYSR